MYIHNSNKNVKKSKEKVEIDRYNISNNVIKPLCKQNENIKIYVPVLDGVINYILNNTSNPTQLIGIYICLFQNPTLLEKPVNKIIKELHISKNNFLKKIKELENLNLLEVHRKGKTNKLEYTFVLPTELLDRYNEFTNKDKLVLNETKLVSFRTKLVLNETNDPPKSNGSKENTKPLKNLKESINKNTKERGIFVNKNSEVKILEKKQIFKKVNVNVNKYEHKLFTKVRDMKIQLRLFDKYVVSSGAKGDYVIYYNKKETKMLIQIASEVFSISDYIERCKQINNRYNLIKYYISLIESKQQNKLEQLIGFFVNFHTEYYKTKNYDNYILPDVNENKNNRKLTEKPYPYEYINSKHKKVEKKNKLTELMVNTGLLEKVDLNSSSVKEQDFLTVIDKLNISTFGGAKYQDLQAAVDLYKNYNNKEYREMYTKVIDDLTRTDFIDKMPREELLRHFLKKVKEKYLLKKQEQENN